MQPSEVQAHPDTGHAMHPILAEAKQRWRDQPIRLTARLTNATTRGRSCKNVRPVAFLCSWRGSRRCKQVWQHLMATSSCPPQQSVSGALEQHNSNQECSEMEAAPPRVPLLSKPCIEAQRCVCTEDGQRLAFVRKLLTAIILGSSVMAKGQWVA